MGFAVEIGMVEVRMRKRKRNIEEEERDNTCMVGFGLVGYCVSRDKLINSLQLSTKSKADKNDKQFGYIL